MTSIDLDTRERAIVEGILRRHVPEKRVLAFGSRARGTAKPYSDLDLAIVSDTAIPIGLMAALTDAFSESDLRFKVDVVDWATTSSEFRKIIERDAVVLAED